MGRSIRCAKEGHLRWMLRQGRRPCRQRNAPEATTFGRRGVGAGARWIMGNRATELGRWLTELAGGRGSQAVMGSVESCMGCWWAVAVDPCRRATGCGGQPTPLEREGRRWLAEARRAAPGAGAPVLLLQAPVPLPCVPPSRRNSGKTGSAHRGDIPVVVNGGVIGCRG